MLLFSEKFDPVKTDIELEDLKHRLSDYDPGYLCQAASVHRAEIRVWMEELWKQYESYADSNFLTNFKHQFSQTSWELYLGTTFLSRGFKLGAHRDVGPDFDLRNNNDHRLAWVEAIAVTKGNGNDRVPDVEYRHVQNVPEEAMLLRISHALDEKFKKYQKDLAKGIVGASEPYVIALNRSSLEHVDTDLPLIVKALFGIGHLTLRMMMGDEIQKDPESFWSGRPHISKKSGSAIPMLFFEDPMHAGISAVIYCMDNILNCPKNRDEMGENFIIIHNPLATNPIPTGLFPFGEERVAQDASLVIIREGRPWEKEL